MKQDDDVYVAVAECIRLLALIHLLWWNTRMKDTTVIMI